ncbi:MAG: pyridoxamine 5'-phosphate oxidase family protein [Polaromonas sp.]|uniref:pyridoxamine 5'-phosphate oxidase family protein n=1 Tax=Polaromonas sp. TaxID=1869339 RepID=UPI0024887537|nr:pyridoxamine 5'-phosphate oxidase family protein [Polaromonas sp.]MDI1237631.1 pyridoxamine 5'-phosphate oxidase family protein [Polaromonas sp.]MDI1340110.1 pyridoxamine 5'-phosphate oxidase family protein [Polaromonas sp.]
MYQFTSDIAFSPTVKAIQTRKGSRHGYARMEQAGSWESSITPELREFIALQTSFYMATVNTDGQPYIQHRGGPAGFLRVLDEHTLAFVDYAGNKQFISQGNLSENSKAHLFLMDYAYRQRIKIWGDAKVVEGDDELIAKLMPADYQAKPEQVIIFTVTAWDANCPQHIPVRFDAVKVKETLDARDQRIRELEAELAHLGKH